MVHTPAYVHGPVIRLAAPAQLVDFREMFRPNNDQRQDSRSPPHSMSGRHCPL